MRFSTRRHFILFAIAISFDLNKIASSLRLPWDPSGGWINYGLGSVKNGLDWMKWGLDRHGIDKSNWRLFDSQGGKVDCARVHFNTGNVNCGGHRARTCSQCPCTGKGGAWTSNWCSGDCNFSGEPGVSGVCHTIPKIKGE